MSARREPEDREDANEEGVAKKTRFWRDQTWGDEQSERDANAVVSELETSEPELSRRWHDHPAVVPFKAIWRFIERNGKRIGVTIAGFGVLIAGVALLVLPGPGWLLIFIGLGILSTEYVWAKRLLEKAREKANQAKNAVLRRNNEDEDPAPS